MQLEYCKIEIWCQESCLNSTVQKHVVGSMVSFSQKHVILCLKISPEAIYYCELDIKSCLRYAQGVLSFC